jgi:death-on-curing protein
VKEPLWLQRSWVDALHFRQLQRFGGQYGIRDEGAIESALARPRHKWSYGNEREIPALAAAYGFGLTQNHGYVDGNKRVGFVAMAVFLELNGWRLEASEEDVVRIMLAVASGSLGEDALAVWVQEHSIQPDA